MINMNKKKVSQPVKHLALSAPGQKLNIKQFGDPIIIKEKDIIKSPVFN